MTNEQKHELLLCLDRLLAHSEDANSTRENITSIIDWVDNAISDAASDARQQGERDADEYR